MLSRPQWDVFLRQHCGFDYKRDADNLIRIIPYIGIVPLVLAMIGAFWEFLFPSVTKKSLRVFIFILFGTSCVFLWKKEVADIYPWATRRYLDFTVPLTVISSAILCEKWRVSNFKITKIFIVIGIFSTIHLMAKPCYHAFQRTEYRGLSQVMNKIASIITVDDVVVADHPLWGTPLSLIYGRTVLDGRHFYRRKDKTSMETGLAALRKLAKDGKRIYFLTSSSGGLKIYPIMPENIGKECFSESFIGKEIVHDKLADDFITVPIHHGFKLYRWQVD